MTSFTIAINYSRLSNRIERMARQLPEAADRAMLRVINNAKDDADSTTFTWNTRAEFDIEPGKRFASYRLFTEDPRWGWISRGTPPHPIDARNAPFLIFAMGGSPKTQPGELGSYAGSSGSEWKRITHVDHPGIKPRHFKEMIVEKNRESAIEIMTEEVEAMARGSGAGL